MAAILVPAYGEEFQPYSMRVKKVKIGSATDNDVVLSATGVYTLFTPSHGVFVHDMIIRKITAFTSGGVLNIGDTDADGYFATTDWTATDVSTNGGIVSMKWASTAYGATVPAYRQGRFYSSDAGDTMAITLTVTTAAIAAGKAEIYLLYFDRSIV